MKKISVSFKNNERDTALYNFLKSKDDKSFYIKEALRAMFKDEIDAELKKMKNETNEFLNNVNFAELENERRVQQVEFEGEDRRRSEHRYGEV